jgi:hypothetical protein
MYSTINIYTIYIIYNYILINIEEQTNQFTKLDWTQVSLCCLYKSAQGRGRLSSAWCRITEIVL